MKTTKYLQTFIVSSMLAACGSPSSSDPDTDATNNDQPQQETVTVAINQVGYLPNSAKTAVYPNITATTFEVIDQASSDVVLQGDFSEAKEWLVAKGQSYKVADFSSVTKEGSYLLRVEGIVDQPITIVEGDYEQLHDAALKSYYFNRASTELTEAYAGEWKRASGHPDDQVLVHVSARNAGDDDSTRKVSVKGWYDAGDYGKYVVNSGIATYTLLAAFEHHPDFYQFRTTSIPESDNAVPDILDEAKWNLDWLQTMQAIDGSVYHKLTTLGWPGKEMPDEDNRARYVIGKSTTAALDFAAVMAVASRVYGSQSDQFTAESQLWLQQAEAAWDWAQNNANVPYVQPADVQSGEYGDGYWQDEFSWAAAELFLTTNDPKYLQAFEGNRQNFSEPSWQYVAGLGVISMLAVGEESVPDSLYSELKQELLSAADEMVSQHQESAFKVALINKDFVWGSNAVVLNKALVLMQAHKLTAEQSYKDVATELLSYVLGKNPTGYSYVTGFGTQPSMYPHHRVSESDGVVDPIPGMVIGGPHSGQQDQCEYPSKEPALSYLDHWCSYSTNEVAINWNAPMVYVLASLLAK